MNSPTQVRKTMLKKIVLSVLVLGGLLLQSWTDNTALAAGGSIVVPLGRSELITLPTDMAEIIVADPDTADVHVHSPRQVSVIGKRLGTTSVRAFDAAHRAIAAYSVTVSYDLPTIRRTLSNLLPDELVAVDAINDNLVITGEVSSASAAERAVSIVDQFLTTRSDREKDSDANQKSRVLNLLQVTSGQQVMLRVRVGEMKRTAVKQLGVNLTAIKDTGNTVFKLLGVTPIFTPANALPGTVSAAYTGSGTLSAALEALETEGLFKVLAEPNLVAISGEKAEFLAGGEFPIPVAQGNSAVQTNTTFTGSSSITVEFKPFGVALQFVPYVLSENRIRLTVQPEVSQLSQEGAITLGDLKIPALSTRRAKTTVEMAPGESFMIAGLLSDNTSSQISQLPGAGEIPILGALFRSVDYQRNETELVIAVTPYIVDPLKASDVKLPTDGFQPASVMESFFYGANGTLTGNVLTTSQTPTLEGPIGFVVD